MTVGSRRRQLLWLIAAFLIGTWGCAPKAYQGPPKIPYRIPWPPSEDLRAQLETVGVLMGGPAAEGSPEVPARGKGSGAARGAGRGALYSFLGPTAVGFATSNPFGIAAGLALGIGLAPVGALVGAVYGAVAAEPAAKVEEAERALRSAFTDLKVLEAMRDRILQVARDQTPHRFVALPGRDPAGPQGLGEGRMRVVGHRALRRVLVQLASLLPAEVTMDRARLGLIAMSGVRVVNERLIWLGVTLPGFVERAQVIASMPSLTRSRTARATSTTCRTGRGGSRRGWRWRTRSPSAATA